jgi:predicted GIY-YIG superfamily endonuclease
MPNSTFTDQQLWKHAQQFKTKDEWRLAGLEERSNEQPSHYHIAVDRGREFFLECCAHMVEQRGRSIVNHQHQKYSDAEIIESARPYQHKYHWRAACKGQHDAGRRRPEVFALATAHMTPAANPYVTGRLIYAIEFSTQTAYVGLTYDLKVRMLGHQRIDSPVQQHRLANPTATEEVKILESGIMDVDAAVDAENDWDSQYRADGWTLISRPMPSVGKIGPSKWTRQTVIENARKYTTRKGWVMASRKAYESAKKLGCFEEAVEHMLTPAESQANRPLGEKRSDESKAKMSATAKRRAADPAWRSQHSAALTGRKLSKANREAISVAMIGVPKTLEHCQHISDGKRSSAHHA